MEEFLEPLGLKDMAGSFQERRRALASMQELLMVQVKVTDALAIGISGNVELWFLSQVVRDRGVLYPNLGDKGPSRPRRGCIAFSGYKVLSHPLAHLIPLPHSSNLMEPG